MAKLPEGFPGLAALELAGEATEAKVRRRIEAGTLTDIDGIGPATAAEIEAAMAGEPGGEDETDAPTEPSETAETPAADVKSEEEAQAEAKSPELKAANDELQGEKLANSRFCVYDDAEGVFVASADDTVKRNERVKVMPIAMTIPQKGWEVRDGDDHYTLTEDMGVTNFGEPADWLKVRSPNTGLALIR